VVGLLGSGYRSVRVAVLRRDGRRGGVLDAIPLGVVLWRLLWLLLIRVLLEGADSLMGVGMEVKDAKGSWSSDSWMVEVEGKLCL
jgi:hypothetical protein